LSQKGIVEVADDVEIIHQHHQSLKTSWVHIFKKHYQVAESFGALFRRWGGGLRRIPYSGHWTHHFAKYLYVGFLAIPFAPIPTLAALFVLSQFTNMESWRLGGFLEKLSLLLLNPALLVAGFVGTGVGFVTGKQRYSQNK